MNDEHTSFSKKIAGNTAFALMDQILFKLGTTAAFVLLVRMLSPIDITAIGIGMGYLVLIGYLDIGLTRILLRDYRKIATNPEERNLYFTAYFTFWCVQAAAMVLVCLGLHIVALKKLNVPGLSFLFLGMTIDFVALVFQDWVKSVFYADLQQGYVTKIGLFVTLARLSCYMLIFFSPSLNTYTWILIGTSFGSFIVWGVVFKIKFQFRPIFTWRIMGVLIHSLSDYAVWDHLNRLVIMTLLMVDTLILSLFGRLHDIGNYTIALKINSLFFLIPWQLARSLQVVLSNYREDRERSKAINSFLKANAMISFAQLIFIFVGGKWLLHFLFGASIDTNVIRFTTIIAVGVTVMNLGWPLMSIINNLCSLRQAFVTVFLPALILGSSIYIGAANQWGAIGMAFANIVVYVCLFAGLVIFTWRNYPFSLNLQWVTPEETHLFREIIGGRNWKSMESSNKHK